MNPVQTGIAVALALVVIGYVFGVPRMFLQNPQSQAPATTDVQTQAASSTDMSAGDQTTTQSNPSTMTQSDGLQITDEVVGTGAVATAGDSVTVNYVGALTNGSVFDASANHGTGGFTFTLGAGQVIKGWDEGLVGMKVGGKRKLVIPAALAYGDYSPAPSIPAGSTLVFEVELMNVQPAAH